MEMECLKVRMLGYFAMSYGDMPVSLKKAESAKSVRLLQMLLLAGNTGIAKNELIDNLYSWGEIRDGANRNRNLNNLIYRLRKQLLASGLPEDVYVEIREGVCYWKSAFPVELDTECFQNAVRQARQAEGSERIRLYREANECYCGELLPVNLTDVWFLQKNMALKELYYETIRELEQEFRRKNDYMSLLSLYERAGAIYPFDSWQTALIRCNLEMYRYDEAAKIYHQTMELYARELGEPPVAELQQCFEDAEVQDAHHTPGIMNPQSSGNFDKIFLEREKDMARAIFEHDQECGAYYCSYPSFVDYCRLIVRGRKRQQVNSVLMFLTLTPHERQGNTGERKFEKQMELLKTAIGISLRSNDAYTRYGNRHYILLLMKITKEDCAKVFGRIESAYNRLPHHSGEVWYHTALTQELEALTSAGGISSKSE